ncbi:MAG: hypothetical protein ABI416_20540 [Ginsengibacter sp.]
MRKLFVAPVYLLGILGVFQSCSKESPVNAVAPARSNVVNATVATNGIYQLPVENSGTVTISRQASHFQLSEAALDSKSGVMVYKYIPAANYSGIDEVVLSNTKTNVNSGGSGCPNNHNSTADNSSGSITTYITIRMNVAN